MYISLSLFFFINDTATTVIYTLSLHDALPIYSRYISRCTSIYSRVDRQRSTPVCSTIHTGKGKRTGTVFCGRKRITELSAICSILPLAFHVSGHWNYRKQRKNHRKRMVEFFAIRNV